MNGLIVLSAPPASGKTYLVSSLICDLDQIPLVLCPLRALADECRSNWCERAKVMTPEEWLLKKTPAKVVIVDEFHLNLYWGDTFRPAMWEAFYGAVESAELVILLTATLNDEAIEVIRNMSHQFECVWVDYGNQRLKNSPVNYLLAPSRFWIEEELLTLPDSTAGNLIFCQYRHEVLEMARKLLQRGFSVWTCLGGETQDFSWKVRGLPPPQFIVSTTVLSHGVNLPAIKTVYFTYKVGNIDFWVQMVARGGRKGEAFDVIALEKPFGLKWNWWTNYFSIQIRGAKMGWNFSLEILRQWFLKG